TPCRISYGVWHPHHQAAPPTATRRKQAAHTTGRRGIAVRDAGAGLSRCKVGNRIAIARHAGRRRRTSLQRWADPANPRAATDLALRLARRHPLAAHRERASHPRRQRLLLPAGWTG